MSNETIQVGRGMTKRYTPSGWCAVGLDYYADPRKGPEWLREQRKGMDHRLFLREIMRDWGSAAGNPFYPEYQLHGGDKTHVRRCPGLLQGQPVLRGWDFGERHPACVWAQYDPTGRRIWVLRELMLPEQDAYFNIRTFRDLVLFLSGELPFIECGQAVRDLITRLENDDHYGKLPMPWFRNEGAVPIQWLDFSGTEANQPAGAVAQDSLEQTKADVLAGRGVYLTQQYGAVRSGADLMRDLLALGADGWSNCLIDPACPIVRDALKTHVTYETGTPQRPEREIPRKDGFYEHLHEALLYTLPSVVPVAGTREWRRESTYDEAGVLSNLPAVSEIGWAETRDPHEW